MATDDLVHERDPLDRDRQKGCRCVLHRLPGIKPHLCWRGNYCDMTASAVRRRKSARLLRWRVFGGEK